MVVSHSGKAPRTARRHPRRGAGGVRRARAPGASTEAIARSGPASRSPTCSGSSAPRGPVQGVVGSLLRETLETFQRAAEGKRGEDALACDGHGLPGRCSLDRTRLWAQMQAYAACDDPDLREVVRNGYGDIVAYVERVSGLPRRGGHAVLRCRDADERHGLDGSLGNRRKPGPEWLLAGCKKDT